MGTSGRSGEWTESYTIGALVVVVAVIAVVTCAWAHLQI